MPLLTHLIYGLLLEYEVMGLKLCVLLVFYICGWRDFKELRLHGRSCLIGQIPAKIFLPQVSSRDIVAGLFSNIYQLAT